MKSFLGHFLENRIQYIFFKYERGRKRLYLSKHMFAELKFNVDMIHEKPLTCVSPDYMSLPTVVKNTHKIEIQWCMKAREKVLYITTQEAMFDILKTKLPKTALKASSGHASKLWNLLPEIRLFRSLTSFQKVLKTYLFKKCVKLNS